MTPQARIFRCYDCGWGLDSDLGHGAICPKCHGNRWTQVSEWTTWESIRYWRKTGVLIVAPTGRLARIAALFNREKAHG